MKVRNLIDLIKKNITLLTVCCAYFSNVFIVNLAYVLKKGPFDFFGISELEMLHANSQSLIAQHSGMLIGVLVFGFLADRKGRMKILFFSVFLFAVSTFLIGIVTNFKLFLVLKFITGFGIASEFGIGLVIVVEKYGNKIRSYYVAFVALFGYLAMFLVAFLAKHVEWQNLYIFGGLVSLFIMIFRFSTFESDIFIKFKKSPKREFLFFESKNFKGLFYLVLTILPIYFMSASANFISVSYFKDIKLNISDSVQYFALGGISCIVFSAVFSKKLRSRKGVILFNIVLLFVTFVAFFYVEMTPRFHLFFSFLFGLFGTYQFELLLFTIESFSTQMRAFATTLVYGLGRSSVFLFSLLIPKVDFFFSDYKKTCFLILTILCLLAIYSLSKLKEHYNRDLNF
jgi:MFS transporter, putative metabolite:H+ symporter